MEKSYRFISFFFVALFAISVYGFKFYFSQFPQFEKFTWVHHIHVATLTLWFALLVIQPVLIYKKKIHLHRVLGKVSYFLVPVIIYCMLLAMKTQYVKTGSFGMQESARLALIYLPAAALIPFVILYILAIINKKKPRIHMRYMIATAVSLLGPGIGRINFGITEFTSAVLFAFALSDMFFIVLLVFEYFKTKTYSPYIISLLICLFFHGIYAFFPATGLWQFIAAKFVENF